MKSAIKIFVFLIVITGLFYPVVTTLVGQIIFFNRSNGQLFKINQEYRGSFLIAQKMTEKKYFWPRPSCGDYQTIPSSASNLAMTNKNLKADSDCSASGLDPDISPESAYEQVERVANARKMNMDELKKIIHDHKKRNFISLFGQKSVNVNELNYFLDQLGTNAAN